MLSDHEQKIMDFVESDGCFINAVFDPDGAEPDFAYSIGFPESLGQPDVLISGLDLNMMKVLINDTLALCRNGLVMEDFGRTDQLLNGYDCMFREVASEHLTAKYWGSAIWFQESQCGMAFERAFQIIWPDRRGRFPWEIDFDEGTGGGQLTLWEERVLQ